MTRTETLAMLMSNKDFWNEISFQNISAVEFGSGDAYRGSTGPAMLNVYVKVTYTNGRSVTRWTETDREPVERLVAGRFPRELFPQGANYVMTRIVF